MSKSDMTDKTVRFLRNEVSASQYSASLEGFSREAIVLGERMLNSEKRVSKPARRKALAALGGKKQP